MEMHYMFDRRVKLMFLLIASEPTKVNCNNLVRILEDHQLEILTVGRAQ
jgi:hypothetical protein